MRLTIHQPEHLPWLGLFHKISQADTFVVLDDVQYRRRYFQNRNKIRTKDGWQWLIVPLEKEDRDELLIKDARVFREDLRWRKDNLEAVRLNYSKAGHFREYWEEFQNIYARDFEFLIDLNMALINFFLQKLNLTAKVVFSSQISATGFKSDLILDICLRSGAKTYISGISGKDYLSLDTFMENGIEVIFQEFHHPIYKQLHEPFIPCMSAVDLLFNHGNKSLDIINGINTPVMENVFL